MVSRKDITMAMEGKDLALLGALGAVGYLLYKAYTQGSLAGILPTTVQADTQTQAATTAGGSVIQPASGNVIVQPTPIVISLPGQTPIAGPTACPPPCPGPHDPLGYMCPQYVIAGCPDPSGYAYGVTPSGTGGVRVPITVSNLGGLLYGGFGSITPSIGFGIRARGNVAATGWERRRATTSFMVS
jgi:hypothetical protein